MPARRARTTQITKAPKPPKPLSAAQRQTKATTQLLNAIGGSDKAAAVAVALEAINERLEWDAELQQSLHRNYEALAALVAPKSKPDLGPKPEIRNPSALVGYNPLAKVDPYQLDAAYEHDQLRRVLNTLTQRSLREAVDAVLIRKPGVTPPNRSANQTMIDFIVEQVAGPGY